MTHVLKTLTAAGAALGTFLVPALAFAQEASETGNSKLNLDTLTGVVNELLKFVDTTVVPFVFAIAFIVFIWGMFLYFIAGASNDEQRSKGRKLLLWGLIAFVVMVSVWGIVNLFANTLGFNQDTRPKLPHFNEENQQQGQNPGT